ncbi:MAG TPA: RAMP superfamily CRISPR-associated protein [Candidatus Saccharimonadales bacterium]|jgi:hypothetical protein|nr:RAMP superfamily CRISPR-associated protein [Candidatus Saccharimonadales bacterium]
MSERIQFTAQALSLKPCVANGHDRRPRNGSGLWECRLTTLTPLAIQALFRNLREQEKPFIPGSSLRGMMRNMVEVLGAGCARFYERPHDKSVTVCTREAACISCRLFGFVEGESGWSGKVRIEDSLPQSVAWERYDFPSQRPAQASGSGWIIFPFTRPRLAPGQVRCVPGKTSFLFRIVYTNLDPEEYSVLKFAVTLRRDTVQLCHTLGYGKSLGFGACVVGILNDSSPAIGPEINPYLAQPAFQALATHRRMP